MKEYRLSTEATSDFESIFLHISADSEERAQRLIEMIRAAIRVIAERPYIGRARSELRADLRSLPVGSYILFYRVEPEWVEIVRVFHGAMDAARAFGLDDED